MNKKGSFKIFWIVGLVIVVLVGILFGIFLLDQEEKVDQGDLNIANWKTYKNDEFGYSFKYPSRFSIIQPLAQGYGGGNILVDPDVSYITVYVVTTPHPDLKEGTEDLIIDGHRAKLTPPFSEYQTGISIYKNENLINIYLRKVKGEVNQNDENLVNKIVSTIELTN